MPSPEQSNPAIERLKQAAANHRLEQAQAKTARNLSEQLQEKIDAGQEQLGMNKNTPAPKQQQPPHSSR